MTCAKQVVTATIIAGDGRRFVGTNFALAPQPTCPRGDMPSGQGYELCNSICRQTAHAEVNAIAAAADAARGAVLYLEGHSYACAACTAACAAAGIDEIIVASPPRMIIDKDDGE
jgi:deoxycytidylate deaminase